MSADGGGHVSERFARLLALYRRPDGSAWGSQDLEDASGWAVSRSCVTNLRKDRVRSPALNKLATTADAMCFPSQLWFGGVPEDRAPDKALAHALGEETSREIPEEVLRLRPEDRPLLLGIARQISPATTDG